MKYVTDGIGLALLFGIGLAIMWAFVNAHGT